MRKRASKAGGFQIWGHPPKSLLNGLRPKQISALELYVDTVTGKAYRLSYENGMAHALSLVSSAASKELLRIRNMRMRRAG